MGAISGGISTGVNAALGAMGMVANNLGTMMLSGAIGGGLTSAAFGGDFCEGATQGALSGALAWRVNQLWGDQLAGWAGEDPVKMAFASGIRGGVTSSLTGGDFGSGFAGSFGNGFLGNIANRYLPHIGGSSGAFDPGKIVKVVMLNDSSSVSTAGQGHTAILFIDANGRGMYYSYNPETKLPNSTGQMRYKELTPNQVGRLINTGTVVNVKATNGANTVTLKGPDGNYNRGIQINVSNTQGFEMYKTAVDLKSNPERWKLFNHNCSQFVSDALGSGGIEYPNVWRPNEAFNRFIDQGGYEKAWKILNTGTTTTDLQEVKKWY